MEQYDFLDRILENLGKGSGRKAFFIREKWHTYGALASMVAEIQALLGPYADSPDHAGVYLADDIQTYASVLALWMSGKAFVPVNPQFPPARNRNIMEQLDLKLLLHSTELDPALPAPAGKSIFTGSLAPGPGRMPVLKGFSREKDAYILFTSGSTGQPKGVRISFHNLNAFVRDFTNYPSYSFTGEDRFLQIYDLSFDASIPCYAVPLSVGASVFTVPPDGIKYLSAIKLMQEQKLTFVKMTPSTLSYLRPYFSSIRLPELKYCLLGGEAFPVTLAREWESCIPHALIQNVYGPTEATIICLIYDWNAPGSSRKELRGIISIGKDFGTSRVQVLGADGEPAGSGQAGELLVAGEQVSPGYWKNPGLNSQAFTELETNGKRLRYYRTGDMVQVDEEGDVMFIGRNDDQVQVRGYRVELWEIESLARSFLEGLNVMASGREQAACEMKIYLAVETGKLDPVPLRNHLSEHLPSYMIPEKIVTVPHFPRLVSGKLDRKAINDLIAS
jgi:D-alanine--poly(phosphoribitol) ligase subunit 1